MSLGGGPGLLDAPKGMVKSTTLEYRILDVCRMFPNWSPSPLRFLDLPEDEQEELLAYQIARDAIEMQRASLAMLGG